MLYSEKVLDHFSNPRNVGELPDANGVGEVGNAVCGDIMKMYLKIENGMIQDVKFKTFGCGAAIATSSVATETHQGKVPRGCPEAEQSGRNYRFLTDFLPPKFTVLFWRSQAVRAALADYYRRQGIDPEPIVGKLKDDPHHCESCSSCANH